MTIDEETIIKNRLLFDTRTLKKVLKRYYAYKATIETNQDEQSRQTSLNQLIIDFESLEYNLLKHQFIHDMNQREQTNYQEEQNRIEQEIADARQDIEKLKVQLDDEQRAKKNRIMYDEVARKINELPSRQQSLENSESLASQIDSLKTEKDRLAKSQSHRRTLFRSVLASLQNLRDIISDPDIASELPTQDTTADVVMMDVVVPSVEVLVVDEEEEEGAFVGDEGGKEAMDVS
ncbi:Tho complex subunit 7-domain-containing protein [Chytridium lagenaria]|nr:Tho complex subunit 7-domain-containing protein [Chytridium lagenaria]